MPCSPAIAALRQPLLLFLRRHPGWAVAPLLRPSGPVVAELDVTPHGDHGVLQRPEPWTLGTITHTLTLDNYRQIVDPVFLHDSCPVVAPGPADHGPLSPSVAIILAYWIAFLWGRHKHLYSFLVILPFWT